MPAAKFVVEDGTGLDTANAYDSVADVAQYHLDCGNDYWATLTPDAQQKAIVRATKYIDMRFGSRFRGTRRRRTQQLEWPRLGAYDNSGFYIDAIPMYVTRALAEYAIRAARLQTLAPDVQQPNPAQDFSQDPPATVTPIVAGQVRTETKKIGPLEIERQYITNAEILERWRGAGMNRAVQSSVVNDIWIPEYPQADLWIEQVLRNPFGGATITRGD